MSNILEFVHSPLNRSDQKRVLIVGQGAAGMSAKAELARAASREGFGRQLAIDICEPRALADDGKGIAWSTRRDWLLCNMPLPTIWVDDRAMGEFAEKLELSWSDDYRDLFPSRRAVGDLLHQCSREADSVAASAGIALQRIVSKVEEARQVAGGIAVRFSSGAMGTYDAVILAIGNVPSTQYSHLAGHPGFINAPWDPDDWLKLIDPDDDVAVMGSSVTGVDAAVSLKMNGHRGKITLVSRGGRLPGSRMPHDPDYSLKFLTKGFLAHLRAGSRTGRLSYREIDRFVRAEFIAAGVSREELEEVFAISMLPAESWLSYGLARVNERSRYFSVIKAIDELFPDLWNAADDRSRSTYLAQIHSDYLRVAWPMAPANALRILEMLSTKQLSVLGGLETCLPGRSGFFVRLATGELLRADKVINASGIGGDLSKMESSLVSSLLSNSLIHPNPFGGGLTDFESGRLLDRAGKPTAPVWATAGALSRGDRLLTNVLSEAGLSGRRTASAVIDHLGFRRASAA
ncbi:FAD/NAD(P)-binding protein [Devosia sp.]|jgi:uncharacterized NAD(P)/FAD-binding protein YdhS|uniref:FAD/NAD(P)-binding protein n=1 Tax=Devosia sp. TaxID=1871048 RepID=UPI003F6EE59D